MRCFLIVLLMIAVAACLPSCAPALPEDIKVAYKDLPASLDYNVHVKPILADKCFSCHGPDKAKQKAGLRLDQDSSAFAELPENPGKVAIKPGSLRGSEFYHRIVSTDPQYMMPEPKSHLTLTAKEKAILIKWIEDGAVYKPHWAFVKPVKAAVPKVKEEARIINPIDNFIFSKLEEEKLSPSKEADKETLLRRVSLDLTGLAPTIEETDNFLKDNSANAYEKQVDRLLASPQYGEKMAVDWLDLARFADSHGYTVDRLRDMSPYRDWVINAFNSNMPYSTFIQWQLAGDLMPHPTKDMIIATAFNRNHQQNMEGGIIEEEYQAEYVVDRTNTFGDAFMGLSVGCAKCHDHKFDPISQKNYYELFSFFNNVKEAGQISWDDAMPSPTLMLPSAEKEKILQFINNNIAVQQKVIDNAKAAAIPDFEKWMQTGGYKKLANEKIPQSNLQAQYSFENGSLKNSVNVKQTGVMKRETGQPGDAPVFETHNNGKALVLTGDTWLDLGQAGVFSKSDPFSIGVWINIPQNLKEAVILHKGNAERLYNYRGYHLMIRNNRFELNMAHTAPSNAITKISTADVPRDEWIQLTITYDGSSKAEGLRLYLNGSIMNMETTMDQLQKDIMFGGKTEPGLQIGGWWRGSGFKGGKADDIVVYNRALTAFEAGILAGKTSWANIVGTNLTEETTTALKAYYLSAINPVLQREEKKLQGLRHELSDSTANVQELMVMQEMTTPKKTYVLQRGNYNMPGDEVFPNTPAAILPFPANFPKNRYGLAQWLTNENHPLTARVEVNRLWQNFFGTGLVKTAEDFGNQGEMPSHPQLLDWLAVSFRESGWDIKKLNKLIVMSAAYRQASQASKDLMEKDPENRLLARGPSGRMSAEMIRDNALQASGLLNKKIGGKSVKPYQPDGLWEINNTSYTRDSGDAVYRRSLYVIVKRSVPNPTLATFDGVSRSYCVVRRQKTNTPLQALVTLNDPTFTETAKAIGEQMLRTNDKREAVITAYRKLTARSPSQKEIDLLMALQQTEEKKFKEQPAKARGWLHAGEYTIAKNIDSLQVAANAVVASTILNSDACLTKR